MGDRRLDREIRARDREVRAAVGQSIRRLREDSALTLSALAHAAGVDRSFLGRVERGDREPSLSTLAAISAVLGADLSVRLFPTTGPRIHDRVQAAMVERFLAALDGRWIASPEVPVHRPARGVIDVVLAGRREPVVIAAEFNSELRRLEQQIRWHREKEASLPSADLWRFVSVGEAPGTSRLLVLRSTRALRDLAMTFEATLAAAYPARAADALAALTTPTAPWPGPAVVWMVVEGAGARLLDGPPRGVRLGR